MRCLEKSLIEEVKDLYSESYKTLMKEIKDTNEQIGRINIVKMSVLTKAINGVNAIPIKITVIFFTDVEKTLLKFI